MEGRLVFLVGEGMKRGWLNWAAEEIVKFDRFKLVGDPEDAELIFTMVKTGKEASAVGFPITGVEMFVVPLTEDGFQFLVHRAGDGRLLWDDHREVNWLGSGAVKDLVRDLHKAIEGGQ